MSAFIGRDKGQVPDVIACAKGADADVLCLQEVMDFELPHLQDTYRFVRFVPMTQFENGTTMGLVTCTNLAVNAWHEQYYMGDATELPRFDESTPERVNATKRRPLLTCDVLHGGKVYRVGNTHFLYTKDGTASAQHYRALASLIARANFAGEMVLCGAMVMPRDGLLYKDLIWSSGFEDWVPRSVTCTLDLKLHKLSARLKSGEVPLVVVDYIFGVGKKYRLLEEVRQFHSVADHTPLLATVFKP